MKVVVMRVKASALGKRTVTRTMSGGKRVMRDGRAYVQVVLGIFVGSDDIPRLTEMSSVLGDRIEVAVEAAVNEMHPEKTPARKIVMKGEKA